MRHKGLSLFASIGSLFLLFSCTYHETINYFIEYRVNDDSMGVVYDIDTSASEGYSKSLHNKYQTVNWGLDGAGVVAVPKDGYAFGHWEKYSVVITATDFVMTPVETDNPNNPTRAETAVYDNLILVAHFVEATE